MDLLQHTIVTVVVLGAFATLIRRFVGFVKPSRNEPACKSCASGRVRQGSGERESSATQADPVVLYRSGTR